MTDKKKNDGGAAFPTMEFERVGEYVHSDIVHPGMSLRDWFAGQALAGLSANPTYDIPVETAAKWSWEQADAMIKAREAK